MIPCDFQLRTRLVFGPDRLDELGGLTAELNCRRALVVSDAGIIAAGHADRALASLRKARVEPFLFSDVEQNPTTDTVARGVMAARDARPDLLIGLGGGSSMDTAKGINFLFTNGGQMRDYWGVNKATKPMLPMIAVPTTAGTGSETQSFALISDAETHAKMACGDKKATFRVAILDPKLTVTQPESVTAITGIDALAHALETYVTTKRNEISLTFSREAWRLLSANFGRVLDDPNDLEARGAMQLGACYAGIAIENSMLGATHALANPLTARYGLAHGKAIAVMLPHVIRHNSVEVGDWYRELGSRHGQNGQPEFTNGEALALFVEGLAARAGLPTRLRECGVEDAHLDALAEDAAKQWTGQFNPRPVGPPVLLELYRAAW
jgi:alcohol dehydrogenase